MRLMCVCCIFIGIAVASGCDGRRIGELSGRVNFKGTPVIYGNVQVYASDAQSYHGAIKPDGTFIVTGLPLGPCRLAVLSPDPHALLKRVETDSNRPRTTGNRPNPKWEPVRVLGFDPDNWAPLPVKYRSITSSGLTYDIASGTNNLDLDLD